jgi:hypothetical protein
MFVILKPTSGTPKANLERAKHEMERVLGFRGEVDSVKALNNGIEVKISINPKWDLPQAEKESYLKEWIMAKVRQTFKALSVSA